MFPALSLALNFLMPFSMFKAVCKSIKLTYNPTSPMLVRIVQYWLELLLNWMKKGVPPNTQTWQFKNGGLEKKP